MDNDTVTDEYANEHLSPNVTVRVTRPKHWSSGFSLIQAIRILLTEHVKYYGKRFKE